MEGKQYEFKVAAGVSDSGTLVYGPSSPTALALLDDEGNFCPYSNSIYVQCVYNFLPSNLLFFFSPFPFSFTLLSFPNGWPDDPTCKGITEYSIMDLFH